MWLLIKGSYLDRSIWLTKLFSWRSKCRDLIPGRYRLVCFLHIVYRLCDTKQPPVQWGSVRLKRPKLQSKYSPLSNDSAKKFYARSGNYEKLLLASSCLSVRPHGTTRLPLDRFLWNLVFEYLFENLLRKLKCQSYLIRITGHLRKDQYTFLIFPRSLLRMRNVSDKSCRENQNTFFF